MPPPAIDVEHHRDHQHDDHPEHDRDINPATGWRRSGSAFRSGITAKSIAAYHVVIGGWNCRRSRTVWTATKKAKPASAIKTPRMTTPNATVLGDRCKFNRYGLVHHRLCRRDSPRFSSRADGRRMSLPSGCGICVGAGEHFDLDRPRMVAIERPITRRHRRGSAIRGKTSAIVPFGQFACRSELPTRPPGLRSSLRAWVSGSNSCRSG